MNPENDAEDDGDLSGLPEGEGNGNTEEGEVSKQYAEIPDGVHVEKPRKKTNVHRGVERIPKKQYNKQNVSRKGKPYVKGSNDEVQERIDFVRQLLGRCLTKSQIVRAVRARFSEQRGGLKLSTGQVQQYIARAKAENLRDSSLGAEELRAKLNGVLEAAISDPEASPSERIRGVEVAMRLFGIDQVPSPAVVNVNVDARAAPIIEIEVGGRDDVVEIMKNPQMAKLAIAGKLGLPKSIVDDVLSEMAGDVVDGEVENSIEPGPEENADEEPLRLSGCDS